MSEQLEVIEPATERVLDTVPRGGVDEVDAAVARARAAYPAWRAVSLLSRPETARRMNRTRLLVRGGAAAALVAGGLAVPLPFRVYAPAELQPVAGRIVYVTVPGRLPDAGDTRPLAALGQTVAADQVLVVLENDELALEVARLEGEQDRLARRLAALEARRGGTARGPR